MGKQGATLVASRALDKADDIQDVLDSAMHRTDRRLTHLARETETPVTDRIARLASGAGEPQTIYSVGALASLFWLIKGRPADALTLGISIGGSALINKVVKRATHRPRPLTVIHRAHASGSSFPSNHVDMSVACYCAVALMAGDRRSGSRRSQDEERANRTGDPDQRANPQNDAGDSQPSDEQKNLGQSPKAGKGSKKRRLLAAILLCSLIGYSRVYLGDHRASDVVGGAIFGAIWLALSLRLRKLLQLDRRFDKTHNRS